MAEPVFELDGGAVCLDFANTFDSAGEHLTAYADLVAFAAQSNLLNPDDADWLRQEGLRDRVGAESVLVRARRLRAAIYAILSAIVAGHEPRQDDVDLLNFDLATTFQHARILPTTTNGSVSFRWGWSGRNMDAPLWGITRSAADLLTSDQQLRLLRQCGGDNCNWLFLDTSKNRSRQWCSMRSCGNRAKARRHYERVRRHSASRTESSPKTGSAS